MRLFSSPSPWSWRRLTVPAIVAGLLFVQGLKLCAVLPPGTWFNGQPIGEGRYLEEYAILQNDGPGRLAPAWRYEPRVSAGVITGVLEIIHSPLPFVMNRVWRPLADPSTVVKLTLLVSLFLAPLWMFLAARWLELETRIALVAMALAVASFGSFEWNFIRRFFGGDGSSMAAGPLMVAAVAATFRSIKIGRARTFVVTGLLWLLLSWTRPTVLPIAAVAAIVLVAFHIQRMDARRWAAGISIVGILAAGNAFWAVTRARFWSGFPVWAGSEPVSLGRYLTPAWWGPSEILEALCRYLLIAGAVAGCWRWIKGGRRDVATAFVVSLLWAFFLASAGSLQTFIGVWPDGDRISVFLALQYIPAALVLVSGLEWDRRVMWAVAWLLWFVATRPIAANETLRPMAVGPGTATRQLIHSLRRVPARGRILIENDERIDGWYQLLPGFSGRDVIRTNDSYLGSMRINHSLSLASPPLPPETDDPDDRLQVGAQYAALLRRLNVGAIVAFSAPMCEFLDTFPSEFEPLPALALDKQRDLRPGRFFRLRRGPGGLFYSGSGELTWTNQGLEIRHASSGLLTLAYHWPGGEWGGVSRTSRGVSVSPVRALSNDRFFISIQNQGDDNQITVPLKDMIR